MPIYQCFSPEGLLDESTRQGILRELSQMWTRLTAQPQEDLLLSLWENPAENAMEGGAIFPGIGQEGGSAGPAAT
jgi:hypothetical protein